MCRSTRRSGCSRATCRCVNRTTAQPLSLSAPRSRRLRGGDAIRYFSSITPSPHLSLATILQDNDLTEPLSPDSVMTDQGGEGSVPGSDSNPNLAAGQSPTRHNAVGPKLCRSPQCDRRSLRELAGQLRHSVQRPGYNESALLVAKAIVAHSHAAAANKPPTLEEAHRFVRAVCGRALFKPCSLIATVVYMERLRRSELHALLHSEGWQLTLLVLLVIAAKGYDSDYPISNADICAPGALPRAAQPSDKPLSTRRVNQAERRVLAMLDYCTLVSPAEFARYYLTLPFAFPSPVFVGATEVHYGLRGGFGSVPHVSPARSSNGGNRAPTPPSSWQLPPAFLPESAARPPELTRRGSGDRAAAMPAPASFRQRAVSAEEMGVQKKGGLLQERYGGLVRPASEQQQLVQPAALLGLPNGSVRADSLP